MVDIQYTFVPRADLARAFSDPRMVDAYEQLQKLALTTTPAAVNAALAQSAEGVALANAAQASAHAAQLTADEALADAAGTATGVSALQTVAYALSAGPVPANTPNARALTGGAGVTIDLATPGAVAIDVDALAILNTAPVVLTQNVSTTGSVEMASLIYDQVPTASTAVADFSVPVTVNGVTYYLLLSTTP